MDAIQKKALNRNMQRIDIVYTVNTVYTSWMSRIKKLSSPHLSYYIYDNDHNPPHVHIIGGGAEVRINLKTLKAMNDTAFSKRTLKQIIQKVKENKMLLLEAWEEKHG